MKKIGKKLINSNSLAKKLALAILKVLLFIHSNVLYIIDRLSLAIYGGVHPKHKIINYKQWFLEHIRSEWIIADIGCGSGIVSNFLAKKVKFVYGIDMNSDAIKEAQNKRAAENIRYILADARSCSFEDFQKVDCVILSNILEHIEQRKEFIKMLLERIPWNKKSGKNFIFRVPLIDRDWLVLFKKNMGLPYLGDKTHFIEYTMDSFTKELDSFGLVITEYVIRFGEICATAEYKG